MENDKMQRMIKFELKRSFKNRLFLISLLISLALVTWYSIERIPYCVQLNSEFLNDENLCDLYKALGPDALCDTCRMYPRHTEEYEGLRELSLSLSCPKAAKIILSCKEPVRFLEEETEEEDDFEDFDFMMFSQLEDTRDVLFAVLQEAIKTV